MQRHIGIPLALALIAGCGDDDGAGNQNGNGNQTVPVCGNGLLELGETCDEGADNSDTAPDACRTDCRTAYCGDGVLDASELCDDGAANSDRLAGACRHTCVLPSCGDGVVDPDETCDDGNAVPGDGCDAACAVEPHWSCGDAPSVCACDGFWRGPGCDACVVHVSADAGIAERDGRGWDTALATVQEGIDAAFADGPGCQVWVAAGRYPIFQNTQGDTVRLRSGVSVYGGFAGTEATLEERDVLANETILDGEGEPTDPLRVFHVLTAEDVTDATVDGVTVTHGRADGYPGTFDALGGGALVDSSAITLQRVTFQANEAERGGAVFVYASNLQILDSSFVGSESTGSGAAILAESGLVRLERCVVRDSRVTDGGGAAVEIRTGGRVHVVESEVVGTRAVYASLGIQSSGKLYLRGSLVRDNGSAGVDSVDASVVDTQIEDHDDYGLTASGLSSLQGVTVSGNGKGMVLNGDAEVRNANAIDNLGEGILSGSATVRLEGCSVTGNGGDGLSVAGGTTVVAHSTLSANAWAGIRVINELGGDLLVTDSEITGNAVGGVVSDRVPVRLERCILEGNTARYGGAISVQGASLTLVSCVLFANEAVTDGVGGVGGAIHVVSASSGLTQVDVVSSVLYGNLAENGGGAFLLEASGTGHVRLDLTSTVVWGNAPSWLVLDGVAPTEVTAHYCDIQESLFPGPANLFVDPLFVDPVNGDFHLQPGSPCIDTGNATRSATTDIEGNPFGVTPDIGAYAYP